MLLDGLGAAALGAAGDAFEVGGYEEVEVGEEGFDVHEEEVGGWELEAVESAHVD